MTALQLLQQEFAQEAGTTKRVLDRVPADKLTWKPHPRSMTIGQLALHIAQIPAAIIRITTPDAFDASQNKFNPPQPASIEEVHAAFETSLRDAERALSETSEERAMADWQLMFGTRKVNAMPRISAWRSLLFNQWYHHRGQLTVYLRLLEIPVPAIYGPSADENPIPQ